MRTLFTAQPELISGLTDLIICLYSALLWRRTRSAAPGLRRSLYVWLYVLLCINGILGFYAHALTISKQSWEIFNASWQLLTCLLLMMGVPVTGIAVNERFGARGAKRVMLAAGVLWAAASGLSCTELFSGNDLRLVYAYMGLCLAVSVCLVVWSIRRGSRAAVWLFAALCFGVAGGMALVLVPHSIIFRLGSIRFDTVTISHLCFLLFLLFFDRSFRCVENCG